MRLRLNRTQRGASVQLSTKLATKRILEWGAAVVYGAIILAAAAGVMFDGASTLSLIGFTCANLLGLTVFDNRLFSRPLSLGRPWRQAAAHILTAAVLLTLPLALLWNAAPVASSFCVLVFVGTRALFRSREQQASTNARRSGAV